MRKRIIFQFAKRMSSTANNHGIAHSNTTLSKLSAIGTVYFPELADLQMVPAGSAVYTSSGDLSDSGIHAIIHAASGSMGNYEIRLEPTLKSIRNCIINSTTLATNFNHQTIAIPFIGGKIFLHRIKEAEKVVHPDNPVPTAKALAEVIIRTALESRNQLNLRFIAFDIKDKGIFSETLDRLKSEEAFQGLGEDVAQVIQGNITKFDEHEADVIVNAANTELQFGGGLSGAIGGATGAGEEIEDEALEVIEAYHKQQAEENDEV
jgi:O-acetyl-ADP-ribose deacetylase (regulator of RNase III)